MGKKAKIENMDWMSTWASLFNSSSFFCLKKDEELNSIQRDLLSRLEIYKIENFHPKRKNEFLLGRLCASLAHEIHFGTELLSLPIGLDRSPLWAHGVIGSITHNQFWVGAAVSKSKSLLGIGIDFEVMGRVKIESSRHIRSDFDLENHKSLNENELLTLIFSAKESLYKALYPAVKCFFGFEAAAVKEIDVDNGTFKIELVSEISFSSSSSSSLIVLGPSGRFQFEGRFKIFEDTCLTVLEVPS